ncbi:hypothetical protein [Bacteroides sedimenti]|uniref:Lipoprotein n=1 Tax=Bacteroides sedimenti TaxID=2136147 RepID=A0ABM8I7V7_9BACE
MKIGPIALLLILLFTSGCAHIAKSKNVIGDNILSMELSRIIINNEKVDSLIAIVISNNQNYLNAKNCFLLIEKIKGDNDTNYVNIMIYERAKFVLNCSSNEYPILGYFEVNNQTVLIVGNLQFDKMLILDEKKIFTFKCNITSKKKVVPPPPSMYNPPFYTFPYEE